MKLKLTDKFADWILKQRIVELASERNESISKIRNLSDTFNKHLFKLYVFQKYSSREHWKDEIYSYVTTIVTRYTWGKKRNRFESDDYYDWLFYTYFNNDDNSKINIKRIYKTILDKYSEEKQLEGWDTEEFYNICDRFYKIICPMLETGFIDDEIIDKALEFFDI